MAASLTRQVRLGFSLGWRIWTPNEVGFYAKTLAHSYFILMILTSKFLKQKIWIVNYTIIIGIKKYFIFVEFLKFGLRSKEERSYWKKVMYITLIARHKKYENAVNKKTKKNHYQKKRLLLGVKKYLLRTYKSKPKQVGKWRVFIKRFAAKRTKNFFKHVNLNFLKNHKQTILKLDENAVKLEKLLGQKLTNKKTSRKYSMRRVCQNFHFFRKIALKKTKNVSKKNYFFKLNGHSKKLNKFLKTRWEKKKAFSKACGKVFQKKNLLGKKKINFFFKINNFNTSDTLDAKKKENSSGFFGNKTLSRGGLKVRLLKNYKKAQKKRIIFSKLKKYISKTINYREKNLHKEVMIISKLFAETLVFKSARKFSIAGGPRKRLSRNLKRAFKSKSVKQIVGLIWFWEKVARMLTFFLKILR